METVCHFLALSAVQAGVQATQPGIYHLIVVDPKQPQPTVPHFAKSFCNPLARQSSIGAAFRQTVSQLCQHLAKVRTTFKLLKLFLFDTIVTRKKISRNMPAALFVVI